MAGTIEAFIKYTADRTENRVWPKLGDLKTIVHADPKNKLHIVSSNHAPNTGGSNEHIEYPVHRSYFEYRNGSRGSYESAFRVNEELRFNPRLGRIELLVSPDARIQADFPKEITTFIYEHPEADTPSLDGSPTTLKYFSLDYLWPENSSPLDTPPSPRGFYERMLTVEFGSDGIRDLVFGKQVIIREGSSGKNLDDVRKLRQGNIGARPPFDGIEVYGVNYKIIQTDKGEFIRCVYTPIGERFQEILTMPTAISPAKILEELVPKGLNENPHTTDTEFDLHWRLAKTEDLIGITREVRRLSTTA